MRKMIFIALSMLASTGSGSAGIIFTEDFEEATLEDLFLRWDDIRNPEMMSFSNDVPPASAGTQSLMITRIADLNTGGHLYKVFAEGYDSLFARFYVKFALDHYPVHHFVHMGGYNPPTPWPQGSAGISPDGTDRFTSGIEPMGESWEWDFYTYWMHMRGNPNPGTYWGNTFNPDPPAPVVRGEWICVEMMMKCNSPLDAYNGEQAFWIDGQQIIHLGEGFPNGYWVWDKFYPHPDSTAFEGFQWRIVEDLNVNFFWLLYYMTEGFPGQVDSVWFDDVVIATEYCGPTAGIDAGPVGLKSDILLICPNPFIPGAQLQYELASAGHVRLAVYNLQGQLLDVLVDEHRSAGCHSLPCTLRDLCTGVYLLRLDSLNQVRTRELMFLH